MRWLIAGALVGLMTGWQTGPLVSAETPPAADRALWQAAGIHQYSSSVEAPTFSLHDLSGILVEPHQLRGRLILLYFWATW